MIVKISIIKQYIKTLNKGSHDEFIHPFSLCAFPDILEKLFWSVEIDSSVVLLHLLLKVVVIREKLQLHNAHTHTQPEQQ